MGQSPWGRKESDTTVSRLLKKKRKEKKKKHLKTAKDFTGGPSG